MIKIEYRVEKKYTVSNLDLTVLQHRLENLLESDSHQQGDNYTVKSIYFDDNFNSCLESNERGENYRKKYRIRTYSGNNPPIKLEIKEKRNGLNKKYVCNISKEEYFAIINGDILDFDERRPVLNEFLLKMRCNNLRPKVLIAYKRTAYVCSSGNVRITFDRDIRATRNFDSFFDDEISNSISVLENGKQILEVKYDEFLPDLIAKQLEIRKLKLTAFSKYYYGRSKSDF